MIDDPKRISPVFDSQEDARVALAMIREFIELHAPPGTLHARLQTGLRATVEAHALIEALLRTSLPYLYIFCRDCGKMRPYSFARLLVGGMNVHAAAEIAGLPLDRGDAARERMNARA